MSTASTHTPVTQVRVHYGDRLVDVAHLQSTAAPRRSRARLFLGLGGLTLVGGLGLFAYETAQPWEAWGEARAEAMAQGEAEPEKPGLGTGAMGLGLALFGLVPFMAGLGRREDEAIDVYSVGESPEARLTMSAEGLDRSGLHALVRHEGEHTRISAPAGFSMRVFDAQGVQVPAAGSTRLPAGHRAELCHGDLRFEVAAVPAAALQLSRAPADRPFWASVGGVGLAAAALVTMATMIPDDAMSFAWEDDANAARYARYLLQADDTRDEPVEQTEAGADESIGGEDGSRHEGTEGAAGKPSAKSMTGQRRLKRVPGTPPQLARTLDMEQRARTAGILGQLSQQSGGILASPYGGAFTSGSDDEDVWGRQIGDHVGEGWGTNGLGVVGTGRQGGGTSKGLIGLGNTGLIGTHGEPGEGTQRRRGATTGFKDRDRKPPKPPGLGVPRSSSDIDKALVRRIVRSHINEVRGCYNQGLARNPGLGGRVEVSFVIMPNGRVASSTVGKSSLRDQKTSQCIAKAVGRWKFPRVATAGSPVTIHYPFVLRAG